MTLKILLSLLAVTPACLAVDQSPVQADVDDPIPDLVAAVNTRDPARVQELLDTDAPLNSLSSNGDTPLCAALRLGMTDIANEFLDDGADATACGSNGQPPIILASLYRCPGVMKRLLDGGANPNAIAADPVAPALLETIKDDSLRNLFKHERKITPLMACAIRGDVEAVAFLISHMADPELETSPNRLSALDLAGRNDYLYVMRLLLGRDPDSEPSVVVTVNLSRQSAVLEVEGKPQFQTSISTGRKGFSTPPGRYVVTQKYKEWRSTVYKVPMPFFMRLNSGDFGLHSGYVTGAPASHGCIRLPDAMARKFFDCVTVGDEVVIEP